MKHPNKTIMETAIEEAKKGILDGQYPLAAAVVQGEEIIALARTTLHTTNDPTAHAEINAIRDAARKSGSRYLPDAWLYTTQEPCPMCTSAAIWAKMKGIVFGASMEDALEIYKTQKNENLTWRQIEIPAEFVISKGEPRLQLVKNFLREDSIKLYNLKS